MMLSSSVILLGLLHGISATSIPPPTGRYQVGSSKHVFEHITQDDPVAPNKIGTSLLITLFYPTKSVPNGPQPYIDNTTASVFESAWNYTAGTIQHVTSSVQQNAPFLQGHNDESSYPTLLFGPGGGGPPSIMYTALLSELASHGYTIAAVDHPYEQPYLQYPDGTSIYGLPVVYSFSLELFNAIYEMRIKDFAALIDYFPTLTSQLNAPFNATHFAVFGHSLGGASALGAMLQLPSVMAGINMDGLLTGDPANTTVGVPDEKRNVMMFGQQDHTPENEGTWGIFPKAQTGWWREVTVDAALHLDFSDAAIWKGLGKNDQPEVGTIDGTRMVQIVRAVVTAFFDKLMGEKEAVLDGPEKKWPELNFVGYGNGNYTYNCLKEGLGLGGL
ncbi:hypothetical protein BU16DRAFT_585720 [Lophium mytilinum]|uniref:1-alkyl-2-acetylglycerophosphocholine esterase n=1 Tax=Lophium mytilinum TaxID=390894 RepID=A0A6A6QFW4_9PEZI|nr:hypothetical protein BU16DRAFT_585720 [Lophium mytilinum]